MFYSISEIWKENCLGRKRIVALHKEIKGFKRIAESILLKFKVKGRVITPPKPGR